LEGASSPSSSIVVKLGHSPAAVVADHERMFLANHNID